jgi:IMP dehydrogenase
MKLKQTLSFDDVLLVPRPSEILTRREVTLESSLGDVDLGFPVISSPMDTVTASLMSMTMLQYGGLGILHRYNTEREQASMVLNLRDSLEEVNSAHLNKISVALPAGSGLLRRTRALYDAGARIFCIDVAHGHHVLTERAIKTIRDKYDNKVTIIAGNVATAAGYKDLSDWGADAVRVGIGGGSICSTRIQTGHGVPTFQSVLDCRDIDGATVIADGGIKTSGDVVKAIAAGADLVMLGSMLAGTDESPGNVLSKGDGNKYKVYRGMASVEAQLDWRGEARSLEGISTTIPYKGSVKNILATISQNLKSGLSYSGCRSIPEIQARAEFIRQTPAGQRESNTHILSR